MSCKIYYTKLYIISVFQQTRSQRLLKLLGRRISRSVKKQDTTEHRWRSLVAQAPAEASKHSRHLPATTESGSPSDNSNTVVVKRQLFFLTSQVFFQFNYMRATLIYLVVISNKFMKITPFNHPQASNHSTAGFWGTSTATSWAV